MQLLNETAAPTSAATDDTTIYKLGSMPLKPLTKQGVLAWAKLNEIAASMGDSWLNETAVIALTGIPRSTLHRYISAGKFPAARRPDGWHTVWRVEDVRGWLLAQAVTKDAATLPGAAPADLLTLASNCDPALLGRVFPRVAGIMGRGA